MDEPLVAVSVRSKDSGDRAFERQDFGTVGIFDVDWLVQPQFSQLLDNLAASPGAFHGVRFFGPFTAGQREAFIPESGGDVWTRADQPIDFATTFQALEALTVRGLIPFVVLGFFPPAVSSSPIRPPMAWDHWKMLVRTFLRELATNPRFGPEMIADWWFEVWNEPNEGRFWQGTPDDYFDMYRATSLAVDEAGISVRLGGAAIAYKPEATPDDGPPWMGRFLRFIAANPELRCDFISLHRKGTVWDDPPDPRRLDTAAAETASQAIAIDAQRFEALTIWNNEADEKVGFEVPYAPRIDERGAAWLAAVAVIHDQLGARYREANIRFAAAADNANLQLVRAPFDGRRSIMTRAGTAETDLLKVPAYGFYELLRLLGDRHGTITVGSARLFPHTDLYHLATVADTHVASLLTYYPDPGRGQFHPQTVEYVIDDLPWPRVNIARFQIDRVRSNAYTVAGGSVSDPFPIPDPARIQTIRQSQEVALERPIARGVAVSAGTYAEMLTLEPFTTLCLWITPVLATVPRAPTWLETTVRNGNAVLRWSPNEEPFFYSYEVFRLRDGLPQARITPDPLRSALWIDSAPSPGGSTYGVRAVSASGVASPIIASREIHPLLGRSAAVDVALSTLLPLSSRLRKHVRQRSSWENESKVAPLARIVQPFHDGRSPRTVTPLRARNAEDPGASLTRSLTCHLLAALPDGMLPGNPSIQLVKVADGLIDPINAAAPHDGSGRVYIVERVGHIRILEQDGTLVEEPFLDIAADVKIDFLEQGLLGLAFHPDYQNNGRFYVLYNDYATNGDIFVVEYTVSPDNPDEADPDSRRLILAFSDDPYVNHNGGTLHFGSDGYLYISMDDGGLAGDPYENAQDISSLYGKIHRIDVDASTEDHPYGIPDDNPYAARSAVDPAGFQTRDAGRYHPDARPEIWAWGLRNPWQFSFDPENGDLYLTDVGQNAWEEINYQAAGTEGGQNYGSDWLEGTHCYPEDIMDCPRQQLGVLPVAEYSHTEGDCSITGMGVYRGEDSPTLDGIYFNSDFCSGRVWGLTRDDAGAWVYQELLDTTLSATGAGQDEAGEVYLTACECVFERDYTPFENPTGTLWQVVSADQVPEGAETAPLEEPGEPEATPAPEGEEAVGTPDA